MVAKEGPGSLAVSPWGKEKGEEEEGKEKQEGEGKGRRRNAAGRESKGEGCF